jgi:hypothetical protein
MISTRCKTLCCLLVGMLVTAQAQEPLKVDTRGVTAKILYEAPSDGGHLPELIRIFSSKYCRGICRGHH